MDTKRLAAALVCVLVLLAGCGSGPTGDNATNATDVTTDATAETTAATNGTTTAGDGDGVTDTPGAGNGTATPGVGNATNTTNGTDGTNATNGTNGTVGENTTVTDAGDLDAEQVRSDHLRVLTDAGSATVVVDTSVRSAGSEREVREEADLDFESGDTYRQRSVTVDNGTDRTVFFTTNGTTYVRYQGDSEDEYAVDENATVDQTELAALQGAFPAVAATNWTYNGVVTRDGENVSRYVAQGADRLGAGAVSAMLPENASVDASADVVDYSAVLFVREDGSVRRYNFDLTLESGGENVTVSRDHRVYGIGSTGVSTPGWVDLAEERAGDEGSNDSTADA